MGYLRAVQSQLMAGTAKFAVIQFKQDWEFLCNVYGFKTWGAKEFCPFCDAAKDPESWYQGGTRAAWRCTVWDQTKLARALKGQVFLANGHRSTKMKWASGLWAIPHMSIKYIKADAMHVLFVDGVVNKTMAWLLYRMCVEREDLPGTRIADRLDQAWSGIKEHFCPKAPPIKDLLESRFRPASSDGVPRLSWLSFCPSPWSFGCTRNSCDAAPHHCQRNIKRECSPLHPQYVPTPKSASS